MSHSVLTFSSWPTSREIGSKNVQIDGVWSLHWPQQNENDGKQIPELDEKAKTFHFLLFLAFFQLKGKKGKIKMWKLVANAGW